MTDLERFEFAVPGYSPETMPLDRLMSYLEQLIIILGNPADLHLVDIKRSSTKPVIAMRPDVATKARQRVSEVRQGGGSARRREAYDNIRRFVAEDGGKPAILKDKKGQLLAFPKADRALDQVIHAVRQATKVEGELIRVGGVQDNATVLVRIGGSDVLATCTAPRGLARELASRLWDQVSVSGVGTWARNEDGVWVLNSLHIQAWEALLDEDVGSVLARLEEVGREWPEDTGEALLALRDAS